MPDDELFWTDCGLEAGLQDVEELRCVPTSDLTDVVEVCLLLGTCTLCG